ncbi:hypothetical protein PINS_up006484 [Pythium insidiosum]|nr:hypothetical protein PINS_up006484 [Pythium insidiosum]
MSKVRLWSDVRDRLPPTIAIAMTPVTTKKAALSCLGQLERVIHGALQRARPDAMELLTSGAMKAPPSLGVRRSMQQGADYQTSLALQLGNRLREAPEAFAQQTIDQLDDNLVRSATVSKGGFINMSLRDDWLAQHVVAMATIGVTPTPTGSEPTSRDVLVDFCAPNYGKKLHVGHLRSSVIGDTICNLLEFRGHRVARVSHTGDVGSAFATLLVELMDQRVPLATLTDAQLGQFYESGKRRAVSDTAFKSRVDDVVLQLQRLGATSGAAVDPVLEATWRRACEVSRDAFAQIWERLRVRVEERGESTYLRRVPDVLATLQAQGLAVESRGALCAFVDGPDKSPMLLQKQDGGYLYATVDLACLHSRIFGFPGVDERQYDEIIYVTDQSQQLHFSHLFKAASDAGWLNRGDGRAPVNLRHAWFGLVLGKDGSKLSSRNGAFDYLEDLLNEAGHECQRRSVLSATGEMSGEEAAALNRTIGDAAVRYFDLAQQRERNYKFLFENVLHLKGNTGVYLLYASARLHGILRKAHTLNAVPSATDWDAVLRQADSTELLVAASAEWEPSERALAVLLAQFDDEITSSVAQLHPHYLCDYLFRVVSHFHAFYEKCRVLGDTKQDSRLLLCAATHAVLARGLQLVGLQAVDRM